MGKQSAQIGENPAVDNTEGKASREESRNDQSCISNYMAYADHLNEMKVWSGLQL